MKGNVVANLKRVAAEKEFELSNIELSALEKQQEEVARAVSRLATFRGRFISLHHEYQGIERDIEKFSSQRKFWAGRSRDARIALQASIAGQDVPIRVLDRQYAAQPIVWDKAPTLGLAATVACSVGLLFLLAQAVANLGGGARRYRGT